MKLSFIFEFQEIPFAFSLILRDRWEITLRVGEGTEEFHKMHILVI